MSGAEGRLAALHALAFERPWSAGEFADLLEAPGVRALEVDGGFVLIRVVPPEAEVLTLAVAPDRRRGGVGGELVERALRAAGESGAEAMFLEVAADNTAALALYERAGFERVGTRKGYYDRTGESVVDALTLRRALNSAGP